MTSIRSLTRRGDTGIASPLARRVAIVLAVLTPLLIAGVAVTALNSSADSASGTSSVTTPQLPAAVVNNDQMVTITNADGSTTPVLAGKLLVTELADGTTGQGFTWNVTDSSTASDGLASGQFAAVVTIPSGFSAAYVSLSGSSPVQAQLQVQTNGANSYVTGMLATALSADLQATMSTDVTTNFVTSTLSAFTTLHDKIGQAADGATQLAGAAGTLATGTAGVSTGVGTAASGSAEINGVAQQLASGMATIAAGTADLPAYSTLLADGTAGVTTGIGIVKDRLATETASSYAIDQRQKDLESSIAALRTDVGAGLPTDQIEDRLTAIELDAAGIRVASFGVTLGLGLDALGVTALEDFSTQVSDGQAKFAADIPQLTDGIATASAGASALAAGTSGLTTGLDQLAGVASEVATGSSEIADKTGQLGTALGEAAAAIPTYTADQQTAMATAVANPIVTEQSDIAALPSPAAAIAAVAVPLALWIGAFAVYLLLTPFTRRALASTASTVRVVLSSLAPAVLLGLIQAAVVAIVLFTVGAHPAHVLGSILFSFVMAFAFVTLHQGLIALFGQVGRMISLALIVVQVAAAAVIIPSGLSSPLYTGLSTVLPLSHAITGMQALIGGGSLAVVAQETLVLLVFAAIGFALSIIAAVRLRSRSLVVRPDRLAITPSGPPSHLVIPRTV